MMIFKKRNKMLSTHELCLKHTQDMVKKYTDAREPLFWSKDMLQEMRNKKLRDLLRYAKANSPWYQKMLADIDVNHFTEDQLHEIPAMNKMTLMKHWDEVVTDRRLSLDMVENHIEKMKNNGDTLYLLNSYHALATSGTSGKRCIYVYNWDEWIKFYLFTIRYSSRTNRQPVFSEFQNRKWKNAMIVISNAVYAMYSFAQTFKTTLFDQFYIPVTLPTDKIVEKLNYLQPDSLTGTPTTISRLCHEPHIRNLHIRPKRILLSGEPLFPLLRKMIKTTWPDVHISNLYASSEGLFGVSCGANPETHAMHLNDDECIIQPVDERGQPINKGVIPHKMYLTNLYLYTLPLIRYEYNDQLELLEKKCVCGVAHQLFAEPVGRPEYNFMYPGDVFVHHLVFVTPLLLEKNIQEYQVIQTERGVDIKILSTGFINKNQLGTTIRDNLKALGLIDPEVTFSEVTQFEYTPAGKLHRFIKNKAYTDKI
ncbi:phenylacetate--CoA ligase family protein [Legionella fallonii]|nr:coenzyme F390 synthetase [Legionella fallonii]